MSSPVVVVEAGCAECHHGDSEPLITLQTFDTIEEAKAAYADQKWLGRGPDYVVTWEPHPQGGEHIVVGQGSVWIIPDPERG